MPIIDCESCGGPMSSDRRCCPHSHCKGGHLRKLALVAALGAAACGADPKTEPGPVDMQSTDLNVYYPVDSAYGPPPYDIAPPPDSDTPDGD